MSASFTRQFLSAAGPGDQSEIKVCKHLLQKSGCPSSPKWFLNSRISRNGGFFFQGSVNHKPSTSKWASSNHGRNGVHLHGFFGIISNLWFFSSYEGFMDKCLHLGRCFWEKKKCSIWVTNAEIFASMSNICPKSTALDRTLPINSYHIR